MPGSSVATILYGQTEPRGLIKVAHKQDRLPGVVDNIYPRTFVPGEPWFPEVIVDKAVQELLPHTAVDDDNAVVGNLCDQLPNWSQVVSVDPLSEPQALHALVIESLPSWTASKKQNGKDLTRYGEHLGIGIYVYDPERERWYQRVMHGRSIAAAHRFPLNNQKTAFRKLESLRERIIAGTFSVSADVTAGYPLALKRLDESL